MSSCFLIIGCGQQKQSTSQVDDVSVNLEEYRWKNRLVLIFSPSSREEAYRRFMGDWAKAKRDVDDRDLLVFEVFSEGKSMGPKGAVGQRQVNKLREQFAVNNKAFEIVLIGKDGGVKLKSRDASVSGIFELIDRMPMRREEMKLKQEKSHK